MELDQKIKELEEEEQRQMQYQQVMEACLKLKETKMEQKEMLQKEKKSIKDI